VLAKAGVTSPEELGQAGPLDKKLSKLVTKHWQDLGMPYDLVSHTAGEGPLRDPRSPLSEMADASAGTEHLGSLNHLLHELHSGLWATAGDPSEQILRALAGHARSLDLTFGNYFDSMGKLLSGTTPEQAAEMSRAAEGSAESYARLSPQQRVALDGFALLRAGLREQSKGTGQAKNFVAHWLPRIDDLPPLAQGRGRPSAGTVLSRERRRSREQAVQVGDDGRLVLGQRYGTVGQANDALRAARSDLSSHLMDATKPLRKDVAQDPEAQAIRSLLENDPAQAAERATQLAQDHFPLKSENFLNAIQHTVPAQAKAILTQKALNELGRTIIQAKRAPGGVVNRAAAIQVSGERDMTEKLAQGYSRIDDPKFSGWVFDQDVAKLIQNYVKQDLSLPKGLEVGARINRGLLRAVMYSPMIHGWNIGRRFMTLSATHPLATIHYLTQGKALHPSQADEVSHALRTEAYQSGLVPPRGAKNWASNFSDMLDSALGDVGDDVHTADSHFAKLAQAVEGSAPARVYQGLEDGFWRWVNDFGVAAYHVEKRSALHAGFGEADARAFAARRANSWMGMVAPEDANPLTTKLSKLAIFAPNWWRTFGELLVPAYRRSGLFKDNSKMARYAATQGLKTAAAMFAIDKIGGTAMNYMLSGHLPDENQPGNQDKLEITNPAILHGLQDVGLLPAGIDVNTGRNPNTGAVVTMPSIFGGQTYDALQAMGYASGQPGTPVGPKLGPVQLSLPGSPTDVEDGLTRFVSGRLSPFISTAGALANLDVYQSLTSGSFRAAIPGTEPFRPSPLNAAAAALMSLPGGQTYAQSVQRNMQTNGADQGSLFGTVVPTSLQGFTKDLGPVLARTAMSGLIGVNPPYASAQKTRGTPMSDADYAKVQAEQSQYQQRMSVLGNEMLSGQITPYAWKQQYSDLSKQHSAALGALFKGAPEYVNGAEGMANAWNNLYDQASLPDGRVDQTKLAQLQSSFEQQHTPDEMSAMRAQLRKNDSRYPGLAFYHATLDAYDRWQANWASQQGLDVTTLRGEVSAYNALYGDSKAQSHYLHQHPEVRRFRIAVKTFQRTPQGLAYELFHGNSATVNRILRAKHLTVADLESETEQAA
jgi:hypothetical protein